jgi:zinc finger protein
MSDTKKNDKPDGAAFDDFFENLGKKAEQLNIKDPAEKHNESGATLNGEQVTADITAEDADEPKVVDEIESLCMNCHENVKTSVNYS